MSAEALGVVFPNEQKRGPYRAYEPRIYTALTTRLAGAPTEARPRRRPCGALIESGAPLGEAGLVRRALRG
jgi:hypothetical protein